MTEITIVNNQTQAVELRNLLGEVKYAALDVETTTDPWYTAEFKLLTVAISVAPGHAFVIPVKHVQVLHDPWYILDTVFEGRQPTWVMQNGSFDRAALRARGIKLAGDWEDTLMIQGLLDPNIPKGLEELGKRWLGTTGWKDIDYKHPEDEELEDLITLNGRDADITLRVWEAMRPVLSEDPALENLYENLMRPAMTVLSDMEIDGIPVDMERLVSLEEEVEDALDTDLELIRDYAGEKFNPNSVPQMKTLLFKELGLPVMVFTDKGAPSTNAESLRKLQDMHPVIPMIQRYRSNRKLLTASIRPWIALADARSRLHPRYKPAQARTGRLASEQPNIQQVPREGNVRAVFGGELRRTIVEVDYSQLELRIVAWLAGEENMLAAFRSGKDLHQVTADALGVPRYTGKVANFGLLYGAGSRKLKWIAEENYGVEMSENQAHMIRSAWFNAYPDIEFFHEACIGEAETTGKITTIFGRIRPLPDIHSTDWPKKGNAERQALNTPVQSAASDITLLSLVHIANDPYLEAMDVQPVATVHDSIVFSIPTEDLGVTVPYIQKMMENPPLEEVFGVKLGVPLTTDVKIGTHWGEE